MKQQCFVLNFERVSAASLNVYEINVPIMWLIPNLCFVHLLMIYQNELCSLKEYINKYMQLISVWDQEPRVDILD